TDTADATTPVDVSNVAIPTITSISYDFATGVLTITGLNFVKNFGAANDIDISLLTFTGENGQTYTLTSLVNIEITSSTTFSITLSGDDLAGVNALLTANGTTSGSGTAYNVTAADNWMTGSAGSTNIADSGANTTTVSGVPTPTITSATYNATTGVLVVTGTNYVAKSGSLNDVSVSKLTLKGEDAATYTLTSTNVEIDSATQFTVTLNALDKRSVNGLLDTNGTVADDGRTYNLAAADDFIAQATLGNSSDTIAAVLVSNVVLPAINSATYNAATGVLVVTGTNFVHAYGANYDVDISSLTLTGEGATSYIITSTTGVEITSATEFTATLTALDQTNVNGLLNKNGSSSDDVTAYNLSAADNWMNGVAGTSDIAIATVGVVVSSVSAPQITSATYDATTGALVVTGTSFSSASGGTNDVDISTFTLTGEGGNSHTITSTSDVEVSSTTELTLVLSGSDKTTVDGLLNKNGTSSDTSATTYNLAAVDDWMKGAVLAADIADASVAITVSNVIAPAITFATYDVTTGIIVATGTHFRSLPGAANDVDTSKLTLKGFGSQTHTLTSGSIEISSATEFTITVNSDDKTILGILLNYDGSRAGDSTVYNLLAVDDWMPGAAASINSEDTVSGVVVSNDLPRTVALTASSNTIVEDAGSTVLTFTFSKPISSNTVFFSLSYSGTANDPADYSGATQNLQFDRGFTSRSVTLTGLPDNIVEGNETIIVSINSSISATEGSVKQQTITIVDEDTVSVALTASATTADESTTITYTATLSTATNADVTVNLGYSGTATSGADYASPPASITVSTGQTTGTATVTTTQEGDIEANETLIVDITSVSGGSAVESGIQQHTTIITDDDTAVASLAVNNASMAEAGGSSTITVSLDKPTISDTTVSLGYSGTAVSGTDYTTPAGSVVISTGQTSVTTTLTSINDATLEVGESIIIEITGVTGTRVVVNGTQQQTVTITDDDVTNVTLTASTNSMPETSGSSTLTATLSRATFENVTVSLGYSGTATSGTDYASPTTSLTIAAGQTSASTALTFIDDTTQEFDENIIVDISSVSGGAASENGIQRQTIVIANDDDDTPPLNYEVKIEELSINANNQNGLSFSFTNAEIGSTYSYTLSDSAGKLQAPSLTKINDPSKDKTTQIEPPSQSLVFTGGGTVVASNQTISGIDASGLADGLITLNVILTDLANNVGATATATTTKDTTFPTVTLTTTAPAIVTGSFDVTATFSEPVADLSPPNIVVDTGTVSVVSGSGSGTSYQLVISPVVDGLVTVTLKADSVQDSAGNGNLVSNVLTVQLDSFAPQMVALSPANNAVEVAVRPDLTIRFDEAITATATNNLIEVKNVTDDTVFEAIAANSAAVTIDGSSATITLSQDLLGTTGYYVTVSPGAFVDIAGHPYPGINANDSWRFTVVDVTPITSDDTATVDEDNIVAVDVLSNDQGQGVALNPASVTVKTPPTNGTTSVNTANGVITYTPAENYNGDDSFVYSVSDLNGTVSNDTTVKVTVVAINDAPVASNDTAQTPEDQSVVIDVLANDTDVDAPDDINAATLLVTVPAENGEATIADGKVTYQPKANFNGSDTFTYTVNDKGGLVSNGATVSINIAGDNDAPVTVADTITT
ncbi:MAG: Ig-like domain-containing protein, partial [Psychrosphaera sp.]|nr:Ig-like domain-containing protein [Psychrosphaera sp.]